MCPPDLGSARSRALSQILTVPPSLSLALAPRVMEIPCGIACRTWGMDVLDQAGMALGIGWVLPTVLGRSLYFCEVSGTSVPWQGRGPAEPTQPRSVNPRCEGEGIKRDRTGKTARQREAGAASAAPNLPRPSLGQNRAAGSTRGSCCRSRDCLS